MSTITKNSIRNLWVRMAQIYGHKWVSSQGETDTNDTWFIGLEELTPDLLGIGLKACIKRSDPWPPSLPEFRMICLGVKDEKTVIQQAISGGGSIAGEMIRKKIGSWDMSHDSEAVLIKKAKAVYSQVMDEAQAELIAGAIESKQARLK